MIAETKLDETFENRQFHIPGFKQPYRLDVSSNSGGLLNPLELLEHLGFADSVIFWFRSYLTSRTFSVNMGKDISSPGELSCGVPQGSILGPLIFLLYVNDMPQAVDCDLLLYADDSCLVFGDTNVNEIEKQLNKDFNSLCDWFVDNKLSIHFGEDKTKSILFGRTNKHTDRIKLDIRARLFKTPIKLTKDWSQI